MKDGSCWNHRAIHRVENGEDFYELKEVFYKDGEITAWDENPIISDNNIADLRTTLIWMLNATTKGILEEEKLFSDCKMIEK